MDALIFFYDFFQVGLKLSIDLFVMEFLQEFKAIPCELQLTTVRIRVSFTVASRLLRFESDMFLLRQFFLFSIDKWSCRITARSQPHQLRLFDDFPGKVEGWSSRVLLVESRVGWPFAWTGVSEVLYPNLFRGKLSAKGKELLEAFQSVLGTDREEKKWVLNWAELTSSPEYL